MSTKKAHKVKELLKEGIVELNTAQNNRLNEIEAFCKKSLDEQNERSKAVQGFLMREVQYKIGNQLYNMEITLEAFISVFSDHGVKIENLNEKIDAKKKEFHEKREKEAADNIQEQNKPAVSLAPSEPVVEQSV